MEAESEDDAGVFGNYLWEGGEEVVIPSDLLHPDVRAALSRLNDDLPWCALVDVFNVTTLWLSISVQKTCLSSSTFIAGSNNVNISGLVQKSYQNSIL